MSTFCSGYPPHASLQAYPMLETPQDQGQWLCMWSEVLLTPPQGEHCNPSLGTGLLDREQKFLCDLRRKKLYFEPLLCPLWGTQVRNWPCHQSLVCSLECEHLYNLELEGVT